MKSVPLSQTYTAGSEVFSAVEFRDPTFLDYRQLGPAFDVQRGIILRDRDAIFAYADRLIQKPAAGALAVLNLEDSMAVEEAIMGFFTQAIRSRNKLANLSSDSDGSLDTSTA